ncbi:MAG: Beta-1,4-mannooligosaccharide phosphorylase [bacterium ADurb.Bin400]|nr:MAG: Beta-1,4-mannooligosaccharide phosphorylase [bacterium ADurb.Bin400]
MISTKDFSTYHRQGVVIHSVDSKDAALFPEMIDGQYVILHRIWIAYSQDLENWYDHRILLKTRKNSWDSGKIGAGSPPIKTEHGWLLFYHGTDHQNIYRLGIILLDLDDPTKVLYRSEEPVLEPEKPYEKEGLVPNVVFTCGVVEKDDKFFVYYGAADRCIGVATIERERLFYEIAKRMHGEMVHG